MNQKEHKQFLSELRRAHGLTDEGIEKRFDAWHSSLFLTPSARAQAALEAIGRKTPAMSEVRRVIENRIEEKK